MPLLLNNTKEIPQYRVCIIDGYPIVEKSLKDAFNALQRIGIPVSLWNRFEKDVRSFFYFYCIQNLYHTYNTHNTKYRKVIVFQKQLKNSITNNFIKNNLTTMLKSCTFPWCEVTTFETPDLGIIASQAFDKQSTKPDKLVNFLKKHKLDLLTKKMKKNLYRQKNTVDFYGVSE